MVPTDNVNGNGKKEIEEPNNGESKSSIPFDFSTSRRNLLRDETPQSRKGFQGALGALPGKIKLLKFGSASAKFRRLAEERDEASRSVASSSSHGIRERINGVFSRKIEWGSLLKMGKEWIRDPMNLALFVWIVIVAVSGAILFLVMTGMLNRAIPKKSTRNTWFEVNNQILNALFTLMALYNHPKRIYHLVLLCRWKPNDISRLRKIYCKNGTYKPNEWGHIMVVVILLHVNCFAQYALCALNVGYRRSTRPAIGVGICISVAIAAPAVAGLYTIISPLGKDYDSEVDEEAQVEISNGRSLRQKSLEKRYSFALREEDEQRTIETNPRWSGGILDFWDDISLAYLSLFCSFCVFGWNMERLGFGNMYVHIATFLLFCMAPFWIFTLAAVNIDSETAQGVLSVAGIVLCLFGLLYGGFWRIQMRKRYNLPPYKFCFDKPAVADCILWLCCCWCTLAQEVRTGNSYDVVENKFCVKQQTVENDIVEEAPPMSPLPREDQVRSGPSSPSPARISTGYCSPEGKLPTVKEEAAAGGKHEPMIPPAPLVVDKD